MKNASALRGTRRAHNRPVNEKTEALKQRTKQFALDVIGFVRALPDTEPARTIRPQLIRASTGAAANYRATCRARSRAEFVARIGVALEEADESVFWLNFVARAGLDETPEQKSLLGEARELLAIFIASAKTASANRKHGPDGH